MRIAIAILLFLLFGYRCVYQVGVVAYYELHKETISKTLCENRDKPAMKCNGKCYLRKQLNKLPAEQTPGKPHSHKLQELSEFVLPVQFELPHHYESSAPAKLILSSPPYCFLHEGNIFRPPQV